MDSAQVPTIEEVIKIFKKQEEVSVSVALNIIHKAQDILSRESNIVEIKPNVVVYGDIHGQYFDFLNFGEATGLFRINENEQKSFLFLGDYVDRGAFSCEVILTLLLLKSKYPQNVFLLRGNHESEAISSHYGFRLECKLKYGIALYYHFVRCFRWLPIAAVIGTQYGKILCLHGGLSPEISTLEDLSLVNRCCEPELKGALCDILWADPFPELDNATTDANLDLRWQPNLVRGCSYHFGLLALVEFLERNNLVCLVRAHELQDQGYRYHFEAQNIVSNAESNPLPLLITVFSAPHYCDKFSNKGAYLLVPHERKNFCTKQFDNVVHPSPKLFKRTKTVEIHGVVKQVLPYIPASKEFFEKMVALSGPRTINNLLRRHSLPPAINKAPIENRLNRSSSVENSPSRRMSAEMHPEALRKMIDSAAGEWLGDDSRSISPNEVVGDQLRELLQKDINKRVHSSETDDRSKIFLPREMEVLKLLFSLMDINGELVLRKEEILHFIKHILDEEVNDDDVDRYMNALDLNGDGLVEFTDLLQVVALMKVEFEREQREKVKQKEREERKKKQIDKYKGKAKNYLIFTNTFLIYFVDWSKIILSNKYSYLFLLLLLAPLKYRCCVSKIVIIPAVTLSLAIQCYRSLQKK